jgi:hypothetical protein
MARPVRVVRTCVGGIRLPPVTNRCGVIQPHQFDYYLDEFSFRFNRRCSRHRRLLFYRLLEEVVATEPIPLKQIVGGGRGKRGTNRENRGPA